MTRLGRPVGWLAVVSLAGAALADGPLFTDVTREALPDVVTVCGGPAKDYIVEVNGGGVGLADFDRDGDLDLLVVDGSDVERLRRREPGLPPRLFLNDGGGRFAPAGESWELEPQRHGQLWGTGCAVGDVDGDGVLDLVVLGLGADVLFLGDGGRGFDDGRPLPAPSDATGADEIRTWSTSASLLDADGDGRLDLFIVRYLVPPLAPEDAHAASWKGHAVMRGPQGLAPLPDQLLRATEAGVWVDATEDAGLLAAPPGFGLGVVALDHDADGAIDLFVANDSTPNHLWRNRGDGTFEEIGLRAGVSHDANGRPQASMGIAVGDLGGDARPELFVTNFSGESNTLYESRPRSGFRDRTSRHGLVAPCIRRLGWGTGMQDVDLDGDLDLWVLNGHVYPEAARAGTDTSYAQADQLLLQGANGRFTERPLTAGPDFVSRTGVQGDIDRDGDLDVVALTLDGPVRVLRNDAPRADDAAWLGVRLASNDRNTQGLGARISLHVDGRILTREVRTCGGFQAAGPAEVHFAWRRGEAESQPRLSVRWPGGSEQRVALEAVDRWITVERATDDGDDR